MTENCLGFFIRTIPSVLEFHQLNADALMDFTTGEDFRLALKQICFIITYIPKYYNICML